MNDSRIDIVVPEEGDETRLDSFLAGESEGFSRTFLQKLIRDSKVTVERGIERISSLKPSFRLREDDRITLIVPEPVVPSIIPQDIPLDIIYEDEDLLVVNKKKGMVVHPSAGHPDGTLVNAVMAYCRGELSGIGGILRPGIVHRIDRDTSGSVLICKNDMAHRDIAEQLKAHSIERVYHAICLGILKDDEITIDANIGRSPSDRKKMSVVTTGGKTAVTHVKVLERFEKEKLTYIECRLETGRTHQIRVHLSHIGHPLLGDEVYGSGKSRFRTNGQCLHAKVLGFRQPSTGEWIRTEAEFPEEFKVILNSIRKTQV